MERDEHGREVRRRPAPGYREPELDEGAWPDPVHSPYSVEGRIEQMGTLARGVNRGRAHHPAVRIAAYLVVTAMLVPIVLVTISLAMEALGG